jgi:hypothetical protein
MKKDKAQRPDLTWVRDELAPINEEHRKKLLKNWKDAEPDKATKEFKGLYLTGTEDGKG